MGQDWIKLPEFQFDLKNRKIYKALLHDGEIYKTHRYMIGHYRNCKGDFNISQLEISFPVIFHEEYYFPTFQDKYVRVWKYINYTN